MAKKHEEKKELCSKCHAHEAKVDYLDTVICEKCLKKILNMQIMSRLYDKQ